MKTLRQVVSYLALSALFWTPGFFASATKPSQPSDSDTIYLQLRWHHQFQFAGYYAAVEKGFYKEEGLNVVLRNGDPDHQPVSEVLAGRALYAEGNSEVLHERLLGKPLVALAAIFQHSPSVLLTLESSGIRSVHDLVDKKVMLANKNEDADFLTMFLNEGISLSQIDIIPSSYQLDDLISGKVDAFNSYTTNEPFVLKQLNIPYQIIDPLTYSVDFYSDIFFTTEEEVKKHPKRTEAMLRATLKGWRYAMDNPEEIIELLKTKYNVKKSREHMRFEAVEMQQLIIPDLVQIGNMNPERWKHMAETIVKAGLAPSIDKLGGFIYDNTPKRIPDWVIPVLMVALVLIILTSSFTFYLHWFNRRMAQTQKTLSQSEERFKAISEATFGGIIIHNGGTIQECNTAISNITGYSYSELVGMSAFELVESEHTDSLLWSIHSGFTGNYEVTGKRKNGSTFPMAIKGKNITYKGEPSRVVEIRDVTESKRTEEQLKLAASVFTHAREAIMIVGKDGKIIDVNDTFGYITGYSRKDVLGKNPKMLGSFHHNRSFYRKMWDSLTENGQWSGELWSKRKDGTSFAGLITISSVLDSDENPQSYVALFSDITPMKKHQQQLEHIAHYDTLTNLPNRMLLADRLQKALQQCERRGHSLAVAYLDLDGFKTINDSYGHDVGDELLIQLSERMNKSLREGDTIARIGGDEFVAVLVDIEKMSDCEQVLERLLEAAMTPVVVGEHELSVSTSIGVTLSPNDGSEADQLMRHADQAMYIAKQTGKNRYHLFDVHKDKSIQTQRETVDHIKYGLENDEFTLHYHPKVNMKTGRIVGAEALIRWNHPVRGLMYPDEFLTIVENQPVSLELGDWVIDQAVSQLAKWQEEGLNIQVSVNIDPYHLQHSGFLNKMSATLKKYPSVDPKYLQLEILETSALGDINEILTIMKECIDIGVSFALDDFGTGFSSLTYLKRLPIQELKVDQSFVRDMLNDNDDRAIVEGVISLASVFNHRVTAEGIETIKHGTQLLSMGCEYGQGHGIAPPMSADEMINWVKEWNPPEEWQE